MASPPATPEPSTAQRPGAKFVYPSQSRPLPGYTLQRGVGMGGFGEIYFATSDAGKEVALKLIQRHLDVELRGIRQCLNLKHPNLVGLYDVRQDEQGNWWVIMEYVAGQNLEQVLAGYPLGMPAPQAMTWIHGIGAGVAYLHERGIVHRDLKPANIFCDEGIVKVGDYGLSKYISCSRRSGHTESIGTVHYMAPEVANGRYGKEIDIYAMGVMLYEMLTGRVPFEGESVGEVLMKHLTAQPDCSVLAEPYRSVVARTLEKDPDRRFPWVAEMLAALPLPDRSSPGVFAPFAVPRPPAPPVKTAAAEEPVVAATVEAPGATAGLPSSAAAGATAGMPGSTSTDEEPIWRAVRQGFAWLAQTFDEAMAGRTAKQKAKVKLVLLVAACVLLLTTGTWILLLPPILGLLFAYGIYRLIRALVLAINGPAAPAAANPAGPVPRPGATAGLPGSAAAAASGSAAPRPAPPAAQAARWRSHHPWRSHGHETAMAALVVKPARQQTAELAGSLVLGSLIAIVVSIAAMDVFSYFEAVEPEVAKMAWLALVAVAATWTILIASKFWEGTQGEQALRRLVLAALGLGVGAFSAVVTELLYVQVPVGVTTRPFVLAYLAVFGTLFFLLRWWRQADPLRRTRLSFWSVIVSVLAGAFVAGLWGFPQSWLTIIAGAISVAVQLASPWVPWHQRGV